MFIKFKYFCNLKQAFNDLDFSIKLFYGKIAISATSVPL